jgi:hypothetical protein
VALCGLKAFLINFRGSSFETDPADVNGVDSLAFFFTEMLTKHSVDDYSYNTESGNQLCLPFAYSVPLT